MIHIQAYISCRSQNVQSQDMHKTRSWHQELVWELEDRMPTRRFFIKLTSLQLLAQKTKMLIILLMQKQFANGCKHEGEFHPRWRGTTKIMIDHGDVQIHIIVYPWTFGWKQQQCMTGSDIFIQSELMGIRLHSHLAFFLHLPKERRKMNSWT